MQPNVENSHKDEYHVKLMRAETRNPHDKWFLQTRPLRGFCYLARACQFPVSLGCKFSTIPNVTNLRSWHFFVRSRLVMCASLVLAFSSSSSGLIADCNGSGTNEAQGSKAQEMLTEKKRNSFFSFGWALMKQCGLRFNEQWIKGQVLGKQNIWPNRLNRYSLRKMQLPWSTDIHTKLYISLKPEIPQPPSS